MSKSKSAFSKRFEEFDIPVESLYLEDRAGKTTIADATCVVHPEGVESHSLIKNRRDDVPVSDLGNFNLVGKPVTFDHGVWDHELNWKRKPVVVGHVVGKRMDENGRLLAHFVLHDNSAGRIAHANIINRQLTDVSPMFFSKPRDERGATDYHCNHLALCNEGRRPGTYILALRSKIGSGSDGAVKHMRLKNPNVVNASDSARHATDVLFQDHDGSKVRDFFVTSTHTQLHARRGSQCTHFCCIVDFWRS